MDNKPLVRPFFHILNFARPDYRNLIVLLDNPLLQIPPDEPLFLLRGQDKCAVYALVEWITRAQTMEADPATIDGAKKVLTAMMAWPHKKTPDAPV